MPGFTGDETETDEGYYSGRACHIRARTVAVPDQTGSGECPVFEGADLLIAADCTAYAYANFHQEFMRGRITLIGCPKLDAIDYSEKLAEIIRKTRSAA